MDCSLLSPVGGSWPRATAEKRSRARGLSRSAEARSPRVIEGAWQGTELERPAGGLGAFLCPAAQGRHNPNLLNPSGLASSHLPGLRDRGVWGAQGPQETLGPQGLLDSKRGQPSLPWHPRLAPMRGSLQAHRTKPPAPGPAGCFWVPLYPLLWGQRLRQEAEEKQ